MPLITCPECNRQISSQAEACPHCGRPMLAKPDVVGGRRIQTTERTAKKFKAHILLSTILTLVGVVLLIATFAGGSDEPDVGMMVGGILCTAVGILWHCAARFFAWWHHG